MNLEKILEGLNDKQKTAVMAPFKPVIVIAGAGAGKTTVLTRRVAYCVENGIDPRNIVAITFTNKAADEMKERLEKLLGEKSHGMHIQTFHSYCNLILREHIGRVKKSMGRNFSILDEDDHKAIILDIMEEMDIDKKDAPYYASYISKQKDNCVPADESEAVDWQDAKKIEVYKEYEKRLEDMNALDFDDLLFCTYLLFKKNPSVLEFFQNSVHALLVDEAQDTNEVQYRITKMLAGKHRNLFVVGDSDQSIYGFRHAKLENFLGFEKDFPDTIKITLDQNYRSVSSILDATNAMIQNNRNRYPKDLWTENKAHIPIDYEEFYDDEEEAQFIANRIRVLAMEGFKYDDFLILSRMRNMSGKLEKELLRARIPYHVYGGLDFLSRAEIKDTLALLRVIVNPRDKVALSRVLKIPKGIGKKTAEKIISISQKDGLIDGKDAVLDVLGKTQRGAVEQFIDSLSAFRERAATERLGLNINHLLKDLGILDFLEEKAKGDSSNLFKVKIENLELLISLANTFSQNPTAEGFLAHITLNGNEEKTIRNKVAIMTCHRAKGLEAPVVFVFGLEEGILPSNHAIFEGEAEIEEERRVAYVAMTRAKKFLFLSSASRRTLWGRDRFGDPSRFLEELEL